MTSVPAMAGNGGPAEDHIMTLSNETLLHITSYLSKEDALNFALVSKRLLPLATDPMFRSLDLVFSPRRRLTNILLFQRVASSPALRNKIKQVSVRQLVTISYNPGPSYLSGLDSRPEEEICLSDGQILEQMGALAVLLPTLNRLENFRWVPNTSIPSQISHVVYGQLQNCSLERPYRANSIFNVQIEPNLQEMSKASHFGHVISSARTLNVLSRLPKLRYLTLKLLHGLSYDGLNIPEEAPFPVLESIELEHSFPRNAAIGERWKKVFCGLKLRRLALYTEALFTVEALLPELKNLCITAGADNGNSRSQRNKKVRSALRQCKTLEQLKLVRFIDVLDRATLQHLGRSLRSLDIFGPKDTSDDEISDIGQACPLLSSLSLGVEFPGIQSTNLSLLPPKCLTIIAEKFLLLSDLKIDVTMRRLPFQLRVKIGSIWNYLWKRRESARKVHYAVSGTQTTSLKHLRVDSRIDFTSRPLTCFTSIFGCFEIVGSYMAGPGVQHQRVDVHLSSRDDEKCFGTGYIACRKLEKYLKWTKEAEIPMAPWMEKRTKAKTTPNALVHNFEKKQHKKLVQRSLYYYLEGWDDNQSGIDSPVRGDEWDGSVSSLDYHDPKQLSIEKYLSRDS